MRLGLHPFSDVDQTWQLNIPTGGFNLFFNGESSIQWIGLRENLQETMVFTIKYRGFL